MTDRRRGSVIKSVGAAERVIAIGETRGRVTSKEGRRGIEGRRGAEDMGVGDRFSWEGTSGRVMDGAGLGDGIERKESRDKRRRRGFCEGASHLGSSGMRLYIQSEKRERWKRKMVKHTDKR
jgi:hypothetical protein